MSSFVQSATRVENRLIAALPVAERDRILPHLQRLQLARGKVLYEAGDIVRHAYFLMDGMASLLSIAESGSTIEIGMIGDEGMVGIPIILGSNISPYRVVVQFPANASRINADALKREFSQSARLHNLLLRYTHTLLTQISQSAACNNFHTVEARLCRWLLMSRDRLKSDTIHLTQEFLSQVIGVPRTSVTAIAGKIQKEGLIEYSRGKIQILDRFGLEASSCECYKVVREEINQLLVA